MSVVDRLFVAEVKFWEKKIKERFKGKRLDRNLILNGEDPQRGSIGLKVPQPILEKILEKHEHRSTKSKG